MSIQIDGHDLFQVKGKGKDLVMRMFFEARSVHPVAKERWAFYLFQQDADDLKAVEEVMVNAIVGKRAFKDRVLRIGKSPLSSEFFGNDDSKAEDLLPAKDVTATITIVKKTVMDTFVVEVSASVGEKHPRIFKVGFSGKIPDALMKVKFSGKAKRITTDLGKITDLEQDLDSVRGLPVSD
jgi:hypothetical protein